MSDNKLIHSVEEINRKLILIDENKNLLPYPYHTNLAGGSLPTGLRDVGDGSILTSNSGTPSREFLLNSVNLPAGIYTISLEITGIIDPTKQLENSGFGLKLVASNKNIYTDDYSTFELAEETAFLVYLTTPARFDIGIVIKPQIEASGVKTNWIPYMNTIGSYVDERFNSITARFNNVFQSNTDGNAVSAIKIGSTILKEEHIKKILDFIDSIELT